jgi:hypothetical protein
MIVCFFLVGRLWRRLDADWLSGDGRPLILVPFLAVAQFGIIRGPMGSLAPIWITTSVLLLLGTKSTAPIAESSLRNNICSQAGRRAEIMVGGGSSSSRSSGGVAGAASAGGGDPGSGPGAGRA